MCTRYVCVSLAQLFGHAVVGSEPELQDVVSIVILWCRLYMEVAPRRSARGHDRLERASQSEEPEVRYFGALACFASLLAESPGALLMEDNRFLQNNAQLKQAEIDEQSYISSLHPMAWEFFMHFIGGEYTASQFRSDTMLAGRRTAAFNYKEVFRAVTTLPWSLTQGDLACNVEQLRTSDAVDLGEAFSLQLHGALEFGMSSEAAVSVLEVLKEAPCTTDMIEQAHGLSASSMGAHSSHGETSLPARSVIHQVRAAFTPSRDAVELQRIDAEKVALERLANKRLGLLVSQKLAEVSTRLRPHSRKEAVPYKQTKGANKVKTL